MRLIKNFVERFRLLTLTFLFFFKFQEKDDPVRYLLNILMAFSCRKNEARIDEPRKGPGALREIYTNEECRQSSG